MLLLPKGILHRLAIVFLLLGAGRGLSDPATSSQLADLVSRYSLGSAAGWPAVASTAGRQELASAPVNWRSLVPAGGYGGGPYTAAAGSNGGQTVAAGGGRTSLLEGTFDLVNSNNFDRYLEELGVDLLLRQLAFIANPRVKISRYVPPPLFVSSSPSICYRRANYRLSVPAVLLCLTSPPLPQNLFIPFTYMPYPQGEAAQQPCR
jgi:hypothetical protein